MSVEADILICGRDPNLLAVRRKVVELSGARVWVARDVLAFAELEPHQSIDLLILCHTLSADECDRAAALAHKRWTHIRSLIMVAGSRDGHPYTTTELVEVNRGPAYLLAVIAKTLGAKGNTQSKTQTPTEE